MTTLWNRAKPLNQPPHYGGLSLSAGQTTRTTPHSSIAVKQDGDDSTSPKVVSDESDKRIAQLIDEVRECEAKAAGKRLELCMAVGDRDGARRHMEEMKAQTLARQGAKFAAWEASH
jgi:hypothetical protein